MGNLFKIAVRNLWRYKRRTLLTASLITMGVIFVLVFISVSGSFKNMIVSQITDSMLGHVQIHRQGYVASIDNLPLNLNIKGQGVRLLEALLKQQPEVAAYSPRLKFGGMFSTFVETTNIRLNGIYPEQEFKTVPLLPGRVSQGKKTLERGEIYLPDLLHKGMGAKLGDTVVIVATNQDGSVNGKQFKVAGILESATGPGGRDGYVHILDAMEILRLEELEVSEVAIRLKDFDQLHPFTGKMERLVKSMGGPKGPVRYEVHSWEKLSPFFNIAQMINLLTFFIKLMLIAIVLISIMNVMIMAVYERIREIGTMAAIGTLPGKILSMFVLEGFCLGVLGTVVGNLLGGIILYIVNLSRISFEFGRQSGLILSVQFNPRDIMVISLIVILVSVLASLQPAFKASRMEPIKALRHV